MAVFQYKASNENGKTVSGLVEAASEAEAADTLKEKRYNVISLAEEKKRGSKKFNIVLDRVKPKDIVSFSRQFAVLISANVALVQSLRLLTEQTDNLKLKGVIQEIGDEVDGGTKLSDSLSKRPEIFSNFFVNVIKAGESSGKLDEVLNYLADELEKDYDMTAKIKGAMIYPAFVMGGMTVVGIVMMTFVVPKLTKMMEETGAELPLPTRIMAGTSYFMVDYWYILIGSLVAAIVGFKFAMRSPQFKRIVDKLMLKIPIFGNLFNLIYLVRFTRTFQTLIVGGVPIARALEITADVVGNAVYKDLIVKTKKEVEDGNSVSSVFIQSEQFPGMVSQMMKIGEKTGRLDTVLSKVTDFYARAVDNLVSNLMTLMEPLIMVIMGVGVAVMVAAIIMPMYQLATSM